MTWPNQPFGELYAEPSRNGLTRPKRVRGAGVKMVNMGELFAFPRLNGQEMDRVPVTESESASFGLRAGDLLFARQSLIAEGAGKCSIVLAVPEPTTFESHLIRVRLDASRADPHYFYYYLMSPDGKGRVQSLVMQVAAAGIRGSELAKLPVPVPPTGVQRCIAAVLSTYDDLIENNTRRIAVLEDLVRSLYREWFVNFRFPGHENIEMVASAIGAVPKTWSVKRIGDEVELAYGKALKADEREDGPVPVYGSSGVVGRHSTRLVEGPGIIVGRKGNVGSVHWSDYDFYAIDTVFYVRTALSLFYVFFNLKTQNFLNSDAAVPGLNRNQAYSLPLLVPDDATLAAFDEWMDPVFSQVRVLREKNIVLRRTRDLLLPRLISGELDVSDLDIDTGS